MGGGAKSYQKSVISKSQESAEELEPSQLIKWLSGGIYGQLQVKGAKTYQECITVVCVETKRAKLRDSPSRGRGPLEEKVA